VVAAAAAVAMVAIVVTTVRTTLAMGRRWWRMAGGGSEYLFEAVLAAEHGAQHGIGVHEEGVEGGHELDAAHVELDAVLLELQHTAHLLLDLLEGVPLLLQQLLTAHPPTP
jgi:hypothetical protein